MALRIVEMPSPNRDARDRPADMLVLHYTGMKTGQEALARLTDPASKVSAHYTIDRDGRVYRHVPEEMRAWHAGVSYWAGETNVNARSIGIEIVNPGHELGYVPFAEQQIAALIDLCDGIFKRHKIPPARVVAHSDVAPARKEDPGELFPWKQVAEYGIGLWPPTRSISRDARNAPTSPQGGGKTEAQFSPPPRGEVASVSERVGGDFSADLSRFGYGVPPHVDAPIEKVITAFQRHYRPTRLDGIWDGECDTILANLLAQSGAGAPLHTAGQ